MTRLVVFLVSLALSVPMRLFYAFVLHKYWEWFAVEHLGWRGISYLSCVAALVLFGFFTQSLDLRLVMIREELREEESHGVAALVEDLTLGVLGASLLLVLGWAWHWGLS